MIGKPHPDSIAAAWQDYLDAIQHYKAVCADVLRAEMRVDFCRAALQKHHTELMQASVEAEAKAKPRE